MVSPATWPVFLCDVRKLYKHRCTFSCRASSKPRQCESDPLIEECDAAQRSRRSLQPDSRRATLRRERRSLQLSICVSKFRCDGGAGFERSIQLASHTGDARTWLHRRPSLAVDAVLYQLDSSFFSKTNRRERHFLGTNFSAGKYDDDTAVSVLQTRTHRDSHNIVGADIRIFENRAQRFIPPGVTVKSDQKCNPCWGDGRSRAQWGNKNTCFERQLGCVRTMKTVVSCC